MLPMWQNSSSSGTKDGTIFNVRLYTQRWLYLEQRVTIAEILQGDPWELTKTICLLLELEKIIINPRRLWRWIIGEIWKIHWKSRIKKHQYCFANISATNAPIWMKFYMVVNYYLVNLCFKFHEGPCINVRAQVVNARTRDKTSIECPGLVWW